VRYLGCDCGNPELLRSEQLRASGPMSERTRATGNEAPTAAPLGANFPAPDFEDSGHLVLDAAAPWSDFRKQFPNVPSSPPTVDLTVVRI